MFESVRSELAMEPIVSKGIINELLKMSNGAGKKAKDAKVAIALIKRHKIRIDPDATYVDSWILAQSGSGRIVCTNDTELRKKLKLRGTSVYVFSEERRFR